MKYILRSKTVPDSLQKKGSFQLSRYLSLLVEISLAYLITNQGRKSFHFLTKKLSYIR